MLTPRQERLILALLSSADQKSACAVAAVSEQSMYRWFKDEEFRAALDAARREYRQVSIAELAKTTAARLQKVPA